MLEIWVMGPRVKHFLFCCWPHVLLLTCHWREDAHCQIPWGSLPFIRYFDRCKWGIWLWRFATEIGTRHVDQQFAFGIWPWQSWQWWPSRSLQILPDPSRSSSRAADFGCWWSHIWTIEALVETNSQLLELEQNMADLASANEWEKGGKWWKILGEGGSRDIKIIKVMMSFNSFSPKPVLDNPRTVGKLRSSAVPVSDRASKLFITLVAGHFDHPTSEGGAPGGRT